MASPRISVVVNTLNEEQRLAYALRSVKTWTEEIVVVDMRSDDRTVAIAKEFGARILETERMGYVEPARALGIDAAAGDWILVLDADEIVPEPLSQKLREIAREDRADVVVIPWLNYLLGAPLMNTGWGPHEDKHLRFFRRGSVRIPPGIHVPITPSPEARVLEIPYREGLAVVHFNQIGVRQFVDKVNSYTTIEADLWAGGAPTTVPTMVATLGSATREFIRRYILSRGYRDGWRGFTLSVMMGMYRFLVSAKIMQLANAGSDSQIGAVYRERAEELLASYERNDESC